MEVKKLQKYIPHIILIGIFIFMLWVRTLPFGEIVKSGEAMFSGNDPYYHMRIVEFLIANFPNVPTFDPWSHFPYGTGQHSGFGGLFDQTIALVSIILGLGNPSQSLVNKVGALAPAFFGAVTVFPTYFITKKITDRWTAIVSAIVLALFTGQFLSRTIVGDTDHQSAEPLLGALAVLGFLHSIDIGYKEKPTIAHFKDKDWNGLKKPIIGSIIGGVAISIYLMTWPPGVMLIFTFGVFIILQSIRDHLNSSPEYLSLISSMTFTVTGIVTLFYARSLTISQTQFSLLQPGVCFGVAIGSIFLYFLSERTKEYDFYHYPVGIATSIGIFLVSLAVIFPTGISLLQSLIERVYSFGLLTSPSALTVAEIQPPRSIDIGGFPLNSGVEFLIRSTALDSFGLLYLIALISIGILIYRQIAITPFSSNTSSKELLILIWSLSMISAYFTMVRFEYYFAVNTAILTGFFFSRVLNIVDLGYEDIKNIRDIKGYQLITILLLILIVIPGNVVALGIGGNTAWETASDTRLSGHNSPPWVTSLNWMEKNTPEVPLEYNKMYQMPEDRDFNYPVDKSPLRESYGVMSWWDYGHWITHIGNRLPYANPFQEGPRPASAYLTSKTEERGELILEALPSLKDRQNDIGKMSNEELRSVIEDQENQEKYEDGRYVMIDDRMAGGKFNPIATWTGPPPSSYRSVKKFNFKNQSVRLPALNSNYSSIMLSKLYYNDTSQTQHYRLVHETPSYSLIGSVAATNRNQRFGIRRLNGVLARVPYNSSILGGSQIKNIGTSNQMIPIQGGSSYIYDFRTAASVKTFERVKGATLVGQAEPKTDVIAFVGIQTNTTKRNFTYIQKSQTKEDGSFSITVPYPTTDYIGTESGATDEAVTALSDYNVLTGNLSVGSLDIGLRKSQKRIFGSQNKTGTVEVPERAIYTGKRISVNLEKVNQTQSEN